MTVIVKDRDHNFTYTFDNGHTELIKFQIIQNWLGLSLTTELLAKIFNAYLLLML